MADVSMHPAAEAEYQAALAWYWARSPRAAVGFEEAVERAMSFVASFPEASPMRDARHRYCALRRYPYGLVYRIEGDQVRIVAVTHARQLPTDWSGRV